MAAFPTVNEEIADELDRLFDCLAARDWASVASFVAIPPGRANPFSALAELDGTGLFLIETSLDSAVMVSRPTAALEVGGDQATLSLDAPDDGAYALAVVTTDVPLSRASICAAPAAVLTMSS